METPSSSVSSQDQNTESIPGKEATTGTGNNRIIIFIRNVFNPQLLQTVTSNQLSRPLRVNNQITITVIYDLHFCKFFSEYIICTCVNPPPNK